MPRSPTRQVKATKGHRPEARIMKTELSILIDGRDSNLSVESFINMLSQTVSLLDELESTIATKEERLGTNWVVTTVSRSNPYSITIGKNLLVDDYAPGRDAIRLMNDGFNHIERFSTRPPYFSDAALSIAQRILKPLADTVRSIRYVSEGIIDASPTLHALAHIHEVTQVTKSDYIEVGTIEGELLTMTAKGGKKIIVRDRVTGKDIPCRVTDLQMEEAEHNKMLTKNVYVTGQITYSGKGFPVLIIVDSIIENKLVDVDIENQQILSLDLDKAMEKVRSYRNAW